LIGFSNMSSLQKPPGAGKASRKEQEPSLMTVVLQGHYPDDEESRHAVGKELLAQACAMETDKDSPEDFELDCATLIPPDDDVTKAWFRDTVLSVFASYQMAGMPCRDNQAQVGSVDGTVCILGPHFMSQVHEACKPDGNFKSVLRVLQANCNFATVKRLVFPANLSMMLTEKYAFKDVSVPGNHFVGMDICLDTDTIHCHDWVPLDYACYQDLFKPLRTLIRQMHKRCEDLCKGPGNQDNIVASVLCLARQNNAHDCGLFTCYMMHVVSRREYQRVKPPAFDLTSEHAPCFRLWLLQNLAPFYRENPGVLHAQPGGGKTRRSRNVILGNIVAAAEVAWDGTSTCPMLCAALRQNIPFVVRGDRLKVGSADLLQACLRTARTDTNKYTSTNGANLPISLRETFASDSHTNTNRIEQGLYPERDKVQSVPVQVLPQSPVHLGVLGGYCWVYSEADVGCTSCHALPLGCSWRMRLVVQRA